jgi:hypothetical protein
MRAGWAWVAVLAVTSGCRLNPECFKDDECAAGAVCVDLVCEGPDAAVGPDGGDDAGATRDGGVERDGGPDGGPDAGDGGCPQVVTDGGPLDDEQEAFLDVFLLHLDDAPATPLLAPSTHGGGGGARCDEASGCPTAGVCGVFGRAFRFGGAPLVMRDPVFFRTANSTYTLEAWVRHTGTSTGCVVHSADDQSNPTELSLCVDPQGRPFVDHPPYPKGAPRPSGAWQHIAVLREGLGELRILQDGLQTGGGTLTGVTDFITDQIFIGGDPVPGRGWGFEGDLDELRLNQRLLLPEQELSVTRPEAYLVWEVASQVFIANPNGFGARLLVADARLPRLAPDLSEVAFTRCNVGCETWRVDRRTGQVRQVNTNSTIQDYNVPVAYSPSGAHIYFVEREGACDTNIVRAPLQSGGPRFIRRLTGRHIIGFDVGIIDDGAGGTDDVLVFTTEGCEATPVRRIERLVDPDAVTQNPVETVFTATSSTVRYGAIRLAPDDPGAYFTVEESFTVPDGRTFRRARIGQALLPVVGGLEERAFDVLGPMVGLRPETYVYSAYSPVPGNGAEIVLFDYGINAQRPLTTGTPTITASIHPDLRARRPAR